MERESIGPLPGSQGLGESTEKGLFASGSGGLKSEERVKIKEPRKSRLDPNVLGILR